MEACDFSRVSVHCRENKYIIYIDICFVDFNSCKWLQRQKYIRTKSYSGSNHNNACIGILFYYIMKKRRRRLIRGTSMWYILLPAGDCLAKLIHNIRAGHRPCSLFFFKISSVIFLKNQIIECLHYSYHYNIMDMCRYFCCRKEFYAFVLQDNCLRNINSVHIVKSILSKYRARRR